MERKAAETYTLALLARREYSSLEIREKLQHRGISPEVITAILRKFQEKGWQSDERFAESLIYSKKNRYGTLKLSYLLEQKGIDKNIFEPLLPNAEEELDLALNLLYKKYPQKSKEGKEKQKRLRLLANHGFSMRCAYTALEHYYHKQ